MERTFVMAKPDAVKRGLVGEIITRFERKGLALVGMKMEQLTAEKCKEHYSHIADKPFYPGIEKFMLSGAVVMMAWEGTDVVDAVRELVGITKAREANVGSIRGDLAMSVQCNLVHASDTVENAEIELGRMFVAEDYFDREPRCLIYADDEK